MKEYERLTEKMSEADLKYKERMFECLRINHPCGYTIGTKEYLLYKRLKELEDKIENGTLVIANKPFVVLDYISNGQEYYAIRVTEEKDLAINLTKAEAEKKLAELKGE